MKPPSWRKTTGDATAQGRDRLGLLPFGPDPVHSRPLHRTRPSSAATAVDRMIWDGVGEVTRSEWNHQDTKNTKRSVILSGAKDLWVRMVRSFTAFRMTAGESFTVLAGAALAAQRSSAASTAGWCCGGFRWADSRWLAAPRKGSPSP